MYALQAGRFEAAIAGIEKAWELLTQHNLDRVTAILNRSVLATAYLRQGKLRSAHQVASNVKRLIGNALPVWAVTFDGYAVLADVYLTLAELEKPAAPAGAQQACDALHRYARVFPIGRPRAWLNQGRLHWLEHKTGPAWAAWRTSAQLAGQLDMPYEEGLAHYEMGQHTTGAERQKYMARAAELFAQVGAEYNLGLARQE
jgi:hypothetical protein